MSEQPKAFENPGERHLRAMLMRFRIELLSAAKALRGDLLDDFWKIIDDVNELRWGKP